MTRRATAIWLGGILLAALALRLWNLDHGLPFAYNADEAEHFVPRALDMAARIADKPRAALLLLKRALALPRRRAFEEARTVESMMHEVCFADPETVARIRTNYGPGQGG